jgi:hypothetical protein
MPKEAQVPVWIIGVAQPLSHEHETPVNPEAGGLACARDRGAKLRFRSSRQNFVGIEDEDPLVAEDKIFQRPVFLFRPGALNSNCTTWAPNSSAMRGEPSVLLESTTKISSAQLIDSRQRG